MRASKRIAQMKEQADISAAALREKSSKTDWCCEACKETFALAMSSTDQFISAVNSAYKMNPMGSFERVVAAYETVMSMYKMADLHLDEVSKTAKKEDEHLKLPDLPTNKKEYLN